MNRPSKFALLFVVTLGFAPPARADVYSYYVYSLEWMTDASDVVVKVSLDSRYDPGDKKWKTRVVRIDDTLKSEDGKPVAAIDADLKAIRTGGTHDHLLFLYRNEKKELILLYCLGLGKQEVPKTDPERTGHFQSCFSSFTSAWEPMSFGNRPCGAILKTGDILTDPDRVLLALKDRVKLKAGKKSCYDGYYAKKGALLEDNETDYNVRVPYDPEYRLGFQFQLHSGDGWTRFRAAGHLGYYNHPEVIANLKKFLDDPFVMDLRPANAPGPGVVTPTYAVRKAAYESLQQLGVTVPKPVLEPEQKK